MRPVIAAHFWLKFLGTTGFIFVFFSAYLFLLKNPVHPVTVIPATILDRIIGVEPLTLPVYLSLWVYLSLPPMLMATRQEIIEYGVWIGSLCLVALTIFYFWPTAVPPANIDWDLYPGMSFLKGVDASGNACPSLHVATATFSFLWLRQRLPALGLGRGTRLLSASWFAAIVYSTMATKQHMALDVIAGIALALAFAWAFQKTRQPRREVPDGQTNERTNREMISIRNLLIAVAAAIYLGLDYIATTSHHPPLAMIILGLAPLCALALATAWKSKARLPLLLLCIAGALWIAMNLEALRDHAAWIYFIQHAGAMTILGIIFGSTLGRSHASALCSRIASFIVPEPLDADYLRYTWQVTLAWTIYFAISAALSVLLFFFAPIKAWSIFANLLTPLSLGAMFVAEYLIRLRVQPDGPRVSVIATIQAFREYSQHQSSQ